MNKIKPTVLAIVLGVALLAATAAVLFAGSSGRQETAQPVLPSASDSSEALPEPLPVSGSDFSDDAVYAEDILFELHTDCISVGHTITPSIALAPPEADFSTVTLHSSDEGVAVIDGGSITAVAPGTTYIAARSGDTESGQWLTVVKTGLVYLSPSSEAGSGFAYGDTNEREQMKIIAGHCAYRLEMCGVSSVIASDELSYTDRASDAIGKNAEIYIGLQADVTPDPPTTSAYYHPFSGDSMNLAFRIYERIAPLSPSVECADLYNGAFMNLKEITYPFDRGRLPSVVIGIDNRSRTETARWIVENAESIGWEIADGIMDYYAGF